MGKKYKIVSLFSGCGGLDLGFIQAGMEVIWANDILESAVETYKKNIGNHIFCKDITKIKDDDIPDNFDILIGGFPCQGFSIANNKRAMDDKRNFLYKEMLRIIKVKKPKYFVAENVKGLLSMEKGKVIEMIIKDFESVGYKVDYKLVKASDYGVPQHRERVFIIGNRIGLQNPFPKKTHGNDEGLKKYVTVKDVIENLSNIRISYDPVKYKDKVYYNHIARTNVHDQFWGRKYNIKQEDVCDYLKYWRSKSNISTKKIDQIFGYRHTAGHWFRKDNNSGSIPNPKDWWKLKEILKFDNKYDKQVTELELKPISFEQSLRVNNWDQPSDTITATGPEIHPNKERRMSVRECAIIQTFPDDFVFCGSLGNMYLQIDNAVPVLLANKVASLIRKELDNYYKKNDTKRNRIKRI
jgi:DNA (cytosine-5)-methyltransferase 1